MYLTGAEEMDAFESPSVMLRYSIPNKTWTVEAEDLHLCATFVSALYGNLMVKGDLMAEGPKLQVHERYYHSGYRISQVKLYKPGKRMWYNVTLDTLDTVDTKSYFIVRNDICYMVREGEGKTPAKVNRVICDFDGDNPTMVIAEAVDDDTLDIDFNDEFTFDKRKVGFERMDCDCESHVMKNQHVKQD